MKKRKGLSMRYQITSDSTCDLSPEQLEQYNIRLLPLYVSMDGKTLRDGVDVKPDDIYAHVSAGGSLPQTAAVNLADYVRAFTELSKKNDFVIHVCISLDFSCCYQNAKLAAADFDNVYVVDSRNLSTGHGLVVLEAERMAREGMEPDDIVAALHDLTGRVEASFILDRLDYMKKGGRCSAVTLLDSLAKRMTWLREILPQLGVEAEVVTARAEEFVQTRREQYDIATSRAVARLNILAELCLPYVKVGGAFLAMKGALAGEEMEEAKRAVALLGGMIERVYEYPIQDALHKAVVIRKIRPTPTKYPRAFAKIKKSPL